MYRISPHKCATQINKDISNVFKASMIIFLITSHIFSAVVIQIIKAAHILQTQLVEMSPSNFITVHLIGQGSGGLPRDDHDITNYLNGSSC